MSAFLILLSCVLFDAVRVDAVPFDTGVVPALLDGGESAWQRLRDEDTPPEHDIETLADLADKLARRVPRQFLKENIADSRPPQQGEAVRLEGRVIAVTKYAGRVPVYRCRIVLNHDIFPRGKHSGKQDENEAEIFTPSIPQSWTCGVPMQESAAAFGIYIKSYNGTPIFIAPALEWYPDTWLGNLGFNVAAFDQVPVSRVTEWEEQDEETNRLMFKFTEADVEPFYGLLRAVSAMPEGWMENEAKKRQTEEPMSVTDLFNRPGETRGKPVLLRGTAKRIVPTPVMDSAVQSLFGIDHYYQVFLFTEGAQGNPIVVCLHSLPEGMPTGDSSGFSEEITVAAIPYKLWIYETGLQPHYAPLLIGRSLTWHPKVPGARHVPEGFAALSLTAFCMLAILWFACRFWARRSMP